MKVILCTLPFLPPCVFLRSREKVGDNIPLRAFPSAHRRCDKIYTVTVETLFARERPPHTQNRPSAIAAEGRHWEPARGSATFSLPPVFPKKTAFLSARTLGTRNHDTHRLQDRSIRRISSMVSPEAEHKAGCLDRISRIYRMMYRDSTFSTTFSTSGYFTSTSSTQYSSVLPAYG